MCFNNGNNNCSCLWLILIVVLICCCCGSGTPWAATAAATAAAAAATTAAAAAAAELRGKVGRRVPFSPPSGGTGPIPAAAPPGAAPPGGCPPPSGARPRRRSRSRTSPGPGRSAGRSPGSGGDSPRPARGYPRGVPVACSRWRSIFSDTSVGRSRYSTRSGSGRPMRSILQIEQPVQELPPLPLRQLGGLVDGVGGGVPVGHHDAARPHRTGPSPPCRRRTGPRRTAPTRRRRSRPRDGCPGPRRDTGLAGSAKGLPYRGKSISRYAMPPRGQASRTAALPGWPCRSRRCPRIRSVFHSSALSSPACTWTRNSGSFIMRPMRRGSLHRR